MTAFVLRGRKEIPPDSSPDGEIFDQTRQLWIDATSRIPVVSGLEANIAGTIFGETLITASREGVDNAEISDALASTFGETTITKTFEGADQTEISAITASSFGETTITRTHEGADQTEITATLDADALSKVANPLNTIQKKSEGVLFDAPYSHF